MRPIDDHSDEAETAMGIGPGDLLNDQFEVGRVLGRGGMGAVHEARDTLLERKVAIKVLPAFLGTSKRARDGLRREAARAIELTHRSLARVYHFGVHQDQPFLVMEFIAGPTLTERLDDGPMSLEKTLAILRPLAAAVDHAHSKKLVHRDIKPANVLLREETGQPVLIDFGIAGEARDQATRSGYTDQTGTTGTLSYMSPEQVRGKPPHPAMDLYALAALAYEMLGGDPPFFRGDPMSVQYQIVNEPPEPLPEVSDAVNQALLRGLAKDPAERPGSAAELVDALAAAGRAPEEAPPAPEEPEAAPEPAVEPDPEPAAPEPQAVDPRAATVVREDSPREDPKAATLVIEAEEEPEELPDPSSSELLLPVGEEPSPRAFPPPPDRGAIALAMVVGLLDGAACAALAGTVWGGMLQPALVDALDLGGMEPTALVILLHAAPLVLIAAPVFAAIQARAIRWIERRFPGCGGPFLLAVSMGTLLGLGFAGLLFLAPVPSATLAVAGAGSGLVVAVGGLWALDDPSLPRTPVAPPGSPDAQAWRGSIGLQPLLYAAVTTSILSLRYWPDWPLGFVEQVTFDMDSTTAFVGLQYLWWLAVVTPALTFLAVRLGSQLEVRYRGAGRAFVRGVALALPAVAGTCWATGVLDVLDPSQPHFHWSCVLVTAAIFAPFVILWKARRLAVAPGWRRNVFLVACIGVRSAIDVAILVFLGDVLPLLPSLKENAVGFLIVICLAPVQQVWGSLRTVRLLGVDGPVANVAWGVALTQFFTVIGPLFFLACGHGYSSRSPSDGHLALVGAHMLVFLPVLWWGKRSLAALDSSPDVQFLEKGN